MTDAPSDRDSLTTWSEPQDDWLPIARAVFRFAIAHSGGPQSTETSQDDSNPFSIEAFEKFKILQDKAAAEIADNETDPLSLRNLRTILRDKARACRAEIDLDEGYFSFFFDLPTGAVAVMSYAPWHLAPPRDPVGIDPRLLARFERDALFNKGDGPYKVDEEATLTARQVEDSRAASSFVWNQLMLPAFARSVSDGRVKVYAQEKSRTERFRQLPAHLWPKLKLEDWYHGTACDPEGARYYSIHAEDSLPKVSLTQASTTAVEIAATKALAAELKRHPNLSRAQASNFCKTRGYLFPETGRPFLQRIWPVARERAGLPRQASAGRKQSTH
jgi:hypothetical protein